MKELRSNLLRRMIVVGFALICGCGSALAQQQPDKPFRGGINQVKDPDRPRPVRNDIAQAGEEIVTLRYFKIKKGTFDEFIRVSVEGVWPYFEKLGSRVIGMWKVITPEGVTGAQPESKDFDEVYLSTRYASLEHWKASRDGVLHGGNGPDWVKCQAALDRRRALTLGTHVIFLKGSMAPGGPYFMPGIDEAYEKKPAK
ncbi:MAG TPA: hypothetical protein VLE20_03920 [Blastocatellia bacterium]|jgi:hypothetical protein|nr:hypothetical protein [Blastocatellia bacterium]